MGNWAKTFQNTVARIVDKLLNHRFKSLLLIAVVFGICLQVFTKNFSNVDNSLSVWYDHHSDVYEQYQTFTKDFGNDRFVMVILDVGDAFSNESLTFVKNVSNDLKKLTYISDVVSLTEENRVRTEANDIQITKLFETIPTDPAQLNEARAWAMKQNNISRLLTDDNGRLSVLMVYVNNPYDFQSNRDTFIRIQNYVASVNTANYPVYYSGPLANEVTFNDLTLKNQQTFLVGMIVVIAAVIFAFFRNLRIVGLPLILMLVCITITQALFFAICGSTNIVSGMIGPILMAACIADAVHALLGYEEHRGYGQTQRVALISNAREIAIPCFFTALTTFAGFISFNVSPVVPNQQLGYFAAFGVMLAYVLTLFLVPLLVSVFAGKTTKLQRPVLQDTFTQRCLDTAYYFVTHHKRIVIASFAVITLISIWGITKIRIETNSLKYFPPSNPQRVAGELVESDLAGSGILDLVFQSNSLDKPVATDPQVLKTLDTFTKQALLDPITTKAFGYLDWIKSLNQAWHDGDEAFYIIPNSRDEIAQLLFVAESSGSDFLQKYKTLDGSKIRLTLKCFWKSSEELADYADRMQSLAKSNMAPLGVSVVPTGQSYMWINLDNALLKTEVMSFSLATVLVALMMMTIMRSIKAGLITLIPNILPIFMAMGAMGFLNIHLNLATVMTAGVAIGITVDDSIHYLVKFKNMLAKTGDYATAIAATNKTVGTAVIFNSVILTAGFLVLCLSSFSPSRYFGAATALTLFLSIFCEILLMPLLLLTFKPFPIPPQISKTSPVGPHQPALQPVLEA